MNDQELYRAAIDNWGYESQIEMMLEECAELIDAIQKLKRQRVTTEKVAEEIADVMIMCGQMRIVFGEHRVDEIKRAKLKRLGNILLEDNKKGDNTTTLGAFGG